MTSHHEWVRGTITDVLSWLATHGFVLSNREEAGLAWLVVFVVFAVSVPDVRSAVVEVLKMAFAPKIAAMWIVYVLWIMSFVWIADWVGIWLTVLTKDTLVWSTTAGIASLLGFTEATEPGYFRRKLSEVAGVVVVFEYLVNFSSFSFWSELFLQPTILFFIVAPTVAEDPDQKKTWRRARFWFSAVLTIVLVGYTIRTLHASSQTIDWGLLMLRAVWPMLLGIWVLVLAFPLVVVASYELAFLRLRMCRIEHTGLWKAKLGLMLALGIRLKWIREAAKGGAGTYHVAHAESVGAAYEAAKRYRAEL